MHRRTTTSKPIPNLRTAPAGHHARRGSTLILVVATLALLAVLTVAYVSIGGGDRRSARTAMRSAEVQRQAQRIADYLAGIIADDALSVTFQGYDADGQPILVTEAADLPYTDPNRTFDGNPAPIGTPVPQDNYFGLRFTPAGSLPPPDPARHDLGDRIEDLFTAGGTLLLPFGPSDPFLAASEPTYVRPQGGPFTDPAYLERTDWPKISNISPDGLFVNLFNLRNNFDAQPGIGTDPQGNPRLSENLYLFSRTGSPTTTLPFGGTARPQIPAHFDSLQVGLFRPVNDVPAGVTVADAEYPAYSFADADGDGFFDSRWQALVDTTSPSGPKSLIPSDGPLRWFVAARIVDLSGRVNVNTARALLQFDSGGLAGAPTNAFRLGATPADVDLRRLLLLEPQWAITGRFYQDIPGPADGSAQDYRNFDDYAIAQAVGEEGYWTLRRTQEGQNPPPGVRPPLPAQDAQDRARQYATYSQATQQPARGGNDEVYWPYAFGLDDLRDLLTYEGLNDPDSLTDLERAVGGRSALAPQAFSPLRENRGLLWERTLADADQARALRHNSVRRQLTTLSGGLLRVPTVVRTPASATGLEVFTSLASMPTDAIPLDPADPDPALKQDGYELLELAAPTDLPTDPTAQATARLVRNAHPLFRTYAGALAPSAAEPDAWDQANAAEWRTTFYGADPLFALRTAAHLTANMTDLYDADTIPSAYTLLVNTDSRSSLESDPTHQQAFPWWSMPEPSGSNPGVSGRLDLGGQRLPQDDSQALGVTAMNVYGLEVHPFITQASLYHVFTDSDEGDYEGPPAAGGPGGGVFGPGAGTYWITMDFSTDASNVDYIGQVLAVQLSNPYTTDIITQPNQYFVRFGQLGGDGSPIPEGLAVPAGVNIPAGQSVVLYIETPDFARRAEAAAPPFAPVGSADVADWIDAHFNKGTTSVGAIRFANSPNIDDFLAGTPGDTGPDGDPNRQVTLWTPLHYQGASGSDTAYVMLDRLYDPAPTTARPTLDRRPPAINIKVENATWGDDSAAATAEENTGYTLATWGTIVRPTGAVAAPRGALPAYVLEKPFLDDGTSLNAARTDDWNLPTPPSAVFTLSASDFATSSRPAFDRLSEFFSRTAGSGAGSRIRTDILLDASDTAHYLRRQLADYDQSRYVSPLRNDNRGRLTDGTDSFPILRPGDFLGVPAVGPVQMPAVEGGSIDPLQLDWFTTGELLTLALGYDLAPASNQPLWYPSLPRDTSVLLDRGHLSLDLPAPYVDLDLSGSFEPANDERRGLGIPHAMAVLSGITTLPLPRLDPLVPVPGLVNLNTATEAALSVLPGLTPTYESTASPAYTWIRTAGQLIHDQRSDVASAVRSYRDKAAARPRSANPAADAVPFYDASAWGDLDPNDLTGRQANTTIPALREQPGLLSVGELLAVHVPPPPGGGGGLGPAAYPMPHLIRRLGFDGRSLDVPGVDAMRFDASGRVDRTDATDDDQIQDDYDEQLALYNAVANSASVRSDVFAVWFLIHGYDRQDVEQLRPDDPMVPTVARRYLMIVDRSNVRRLGDRPRILLFEELPL